MSDEDRWLEADVTVNGKPLTTAQVLTVRVALSSWHMWLAATEDSLGTEEHGRTMRLNYLRLLDEVLPLLVAPPVSKTIPTVSRHERLRIIVDDEIEHEGVALTCEVVEQFNAIEISEPLSVEEANRQIEEMGAYEFRDRVEPDGAWVRK